MCVAAGVGARKERSRGYEGGYCSFGEYLPCISASYIYVSTITSVLHLETGKNIQ